MPKLEYIGVQNNTIDLFNNPFFTLTNIDGFTLATAEISSSTTPSMDGDIINNSIVQARPVVLDLRVKGNVRVEDAKAYLLKAVKPKQKGILRLTQTGKTPTELVGIVEEITMPRFEQGVTCQVTLHCSNPYWQDAQYLILEISRIINMHYFPAESGGLAFPADGIVMGEYKQDNTQTYTNDGDVETGMLITIVCIGAVVNPSIYNMRGEYIGINDTLQAGDIVEINTNRGEKSVKKNGTNIFSKLKSGSKFLQLEVGDNQFTTTAQAMTQNNMYFSLTFKRRFV